MVRCPIQGRNIAVISVAGSSVRLTEDCVHKLAPKLRQAVEELSKRNQAS